MFFIWATLIHTVDSTLYSSQLLLSLNQWRWYCSTQHILKSGSFTIIQFRALSLSLSPSTKSDRCFYALFSDYNACNFNQSPGKLYHLCKIIALTGCHLSFFHRLENACRHKPKVRFFCSGETQMSHISFDIFNNQMSSFESRPMCHYILIGLFSHLSFSF